MEHLQDRLLGRGPRIRDSCRAGPQRRDTRRQAAMRPTMLPRSPRREVGGQAPDTVQRCRETPPMPRPSAATVTPGAVREPARRT
jgi:hypothetical protein